MRCYRLVDLHTGERVGEFESEDAALFEVAARLRGRGREAALGLALTYCDPEGIGHVIADGATLADRALQSVA
ncbi:MAG TPA: hypothetical protein VG370_09165 [Chloroflexota bacterium]|nr:hypothetical protein [Chloroflexota bacterium]